jgi:hypothetical protein
LQPIRFGEFLCERQLISEEELLASLGEHWSNGGRIGAAVARLGFVETREVERHALVYHQLDIIEIDQSASGTWRQASA